MVLPAAAATGRVIAGSAQATTRTNRVKRDPLQRTSIRTRRDDRQNASRLSQQMRAESPELSAAQINAGLPRITKGLPTGQTRQLAAKRGNSVTSLARTAFRYVRAVVAAFTTMALYFWFYLIQLGFGIVFIVMGYVSQTWIGWGTNWFFGFTTFSILGWLICSIISLVFMLIAIVALITARAKVGKNLTMLMFLIGITGSIVPYFNLLPWPAFFMAVAVANQK